MKEQHGGRTARRMKKDDETARRKNFLVNLHGGRNETARKSTFFPAGLVVEELCVLKTTPERHARHEIILAHPQDEINSTHEYLNDFHCIEH